VTAQARYFLTSKQKPHHTAEFCRLKKISQKGMAEAEAAFNIGSHLKKRGLPVPVIHAFDPASGFILFEDLGETLLHDLLQKKKNNPGEPFGQEITELYKEIVEILLFMQISGSVRFDRKWWIGRAHV